MKRHFVAMMMLGVFCAPALQAQNAAPSMSNAIKQQYNEIKNNLLKAADKMPESAYSFQPIKEERTFGGWVAHVADTHMNICSRIAGAQKNINAASKTSKADLVAALKESFDTCDALYNGLTDANASEPVPMFRGQQSGEDAGVRDERQRTVRVGVLVQDGVGAQTVERRRLDLRVPIRRKVIGAEGVDGDEDDRRVSRDAVRSAAPPSHERDQCDERKPLHHSQH